MAYLDENGLEHFWGKIKDRVSSAVAPKANDADVVHKTGDETVQGTKTFSNTYTYDNGSKSSNISIQDPEIVKGTAPETKHYSSLVFTDSEGEVFDNHGRLAVIEYQAPSESRPNSELTLAAYPFIPASDSGSAKWTGLTTGFDGNLVPFATAPDTSDDRTNATDIVTRGYMEASEWNWQKSKKNAVVQFKPVPESDLEPVVDFMFTETLPISGEKGPENPSTITGVSSVKVTRCGKNLDHVRSTTTLNYVTFTNNGDGSYTVDGTATGGNAVIYLVSVQSEKIQCAAGQTFVASGCPSGGNASTYSTYIGVYNKNGDFVAGKYDTGNSASLVVSEDGFIIHCIIIKNGTTVSNLVFWPKLELGSVATSFEKFDGSEYTIQLGDTYYGGSLDVATGVMTVTHVYVAFTGAEQDLYWGRYTKTNTAVFNTSGVAWLARLPKPKNPAAGPVCTHFPFLYNASSDTVHFYIFSDGHAVFYYPDPNFTVEDWKSYLAAQYAAGTPVTVCYEAEVPLGTVQLTPTQIRSLLALDKYEPRINTVYTDQEAVQVGYQRYANYVDLNTNQIVGGQKIFTSNIQLKRDIPTIFLDVQGTSRGDIQFREVNTAVSVIRQQVGGTFQIGRASSTGGSWFNGAQLNLFASGDASLKARRDAEGETGYSLSLGVNGTLVWDGQPLQTSSDERVKTPLSSVPDAVLDAWEEVNWGQFQYLDAVASKGESARLHLGLIAQHVMSVFEKHGLDACGYGILCHEERPAIDEEETVVDAEAYTDAEGVEHPAVTHVETRHEDAVDLWMVRYAEAQAMEACCMRRENARLKKRVADLEERLAALELKIF